MLRSTLVEINNCQTEKDLLAVTQGIKAVLVNLPGLNQDSKLAEELTALSTRLEGSKAERMSKMATLVKQLEASADLKKQKSILGDILSLLGEEVGVKMPKSKRGLCGQSIACNVACVATTTVAATGITLAALFMAGAMGDEVLSAEVEGEADEVAETEVDADMQAAAETGETAPDSDRLSDAIFGPKAERMLRVVRKHEDLANAVFGDEVVDISTDENRELFQRNVEMIFNVARRFDTDSEFVRWNMFEDSALEEVEIINFEEMRYDILTEIDNDEQLDDYSWRSEFFPEDADGNPIVTDAAGNPVPRDQLAALYHDLADETKSMRDIRNEYSVDYMKTLMGITQNADGTYATVEDSGFRAADYLVSWSDAHELGDNETESPVTFAFEQWSLGHKTDAELVEELIPHIKSEYQVDVDSIDDILIDMEAEIAREHEYNETVERLEEELESATNNLDDTWRTLATMKSIQMKQLEADLLYEIEHLNDAEAQKEVNRTAQRMFKVMRKVMRKDLNKAGIVDPRTQAWQSADVADFVDCVNGFFTDKDVSYKVDAAFPQS